MEKVSSKKYEIDMCNGPLLGKILIFYVPLMLSGILQLLFNAADIVVVGRFAGNEALAAVGSTSSLTNLLVNLFIGLSVGANVLVARFYGAKQASELTEMVQTAVATAVAGGVILIFLGFFLAKPALGWMGTPDDVISHSVLYMRIYFAGMPFMMVYNFGSAVLRAVGDTKRPLYYLLIAGVVNVVLNLIFVIVFGMGVAGVATATVISQAVSGIWVLRFLTGKKTTLRLKRSTLRPSWRLMAPVLALGVAPFVMQSTEALLNISFNSSLQRYGGDVAVGAMTIASTVMQIVWIPAQGLGQGAQPIISYNYGARNAKRVKEAFFALLKVSCIFLASFWLLVQLFPRFFISIFNNDPQLVDTAVWTLRVYTAVLGMFGVQMSVQQTFTAIGKAKASLFIACLRKVILLIPLIFLLPLFFENKVLAVFLAEPVSDFISVTASAITFCLVFRPAMAELEKEK